MCICDIGEIIFWKKMFITKNYRGIFRIQKNLFWSSCFTKLHAILLHLNEFPFQRIIIKLLAASDACAAYWKHILNKISYNITIFIKIYSQMWSQIKMIFINKLSMFIGIVLECLVMSFTKFIFMCIFSGCKHEYCWEKGWRL